jgi:hypothetical protein
MASRPLTAGDSRAVARPRPEPFLTVRVQDLGLEPTLTAACAGFESREWRCRQLARHALEWLGDFALTHTEHERFAPHNASEFLARAATAVYDSDRYERRGEFGELLLHALLRQEFGTEPAISKVFFKDTANATVHGFDAVHVVAADDGLELWLGEVKFYGAVSDAMTAVAQELREHTEANWMRREFLAISNKIDPAWPHADALRELIHRNRPIEQIVERIRIPVLVTYDSEIVGSATEATQGFIAGFEAEVCELQTRFRRRRLPQDVVIHLLLLPLASKSDLVAAMDEQLSHYRAL